MLLTGDAQGWNATIRRVAIDPAPVLEEFERQRFVEACGVIGQLVVEEFRTAKLQVLPFLRWRRASCPDAPLTDETLARYADADRRVYIPAAYRKAEDGPTATGGR
jgi:hypothetical protein